MIFQTWQPPQLSKHKRNKVGILWADAELNRASNPLAWQCAALQEQCCSAADPFLQVAAKPVTTELSARLQVITRHAPERVKIHNNLWETVSARTCLLVHVRPQLACKILMLRYAQRAKHDVFKHLPLPDPCLNATNMSGKVLQRTQLAALHGKSVDLPPQARRQKAPLQHGAGPEGSKATKEQEKDSSGKV